ncbi:hypothetical protein [Fusobacterium animalis]|uniref:hypothetical protein n=1 Tax=Fusobacterium animalis TaxID=76859 RepID=UPI0030CE419E
MSDKKVEFSEMAKSISTLVSAVVKNIQNGLGSFEKSSDFENFFKDIYGGKTIEIEKIKFILKEVIKKREKMGKKSSAKKVRREIENFEKNKVKDLEIKEEKILVQDINLKELSKYEKIKKFRNLENINITYGDNEKDKFKDFQEIYNLISNEIVIQRKREIYSKKDKIFYFLQHKLFTTERLKGEYSIFTSNKEEKNNLNNIKKISNRIREKGIEFSLPDEKSIKLLKNTGFIGNGCWIYYYKENNISYSNYMRISDTYNYSLDCQYEYNLLGIYKLDKFFNFLKDRNQKFNLKENNNLKNFEVILNYDLLDISIITKECEERFNKLVEAYKKYKEYISCIYNEDDKKIGILFDTNKIIESIKNKKKLFNNIEITYLENQLGIEKEIVYSDRNVYYYENGEIEEVYNNNLGENKSIYHFKNGDIEERIYKDGILKGKAIYKNENKEREYFYTNGVRKEMPKLKYYLSIDRERINIDDYQETMLTDPNIGHWDLKEEDKKELKEILGKNVYKRDPKLDINQGGIVAIDFGTKSTVVVYQKDSENILPMRISGDKLNREVRNTDYENPTVIEFRDINKFLKDYKVKVGRPDTKWEDITVSHTAFGNLTEVSSEHFDSIISDIKQWTASKNQKIVVVDRKGKEILLPPYLELNEKSKDYLDPVELYAYYIGSYINNMINGIYLEYYLSFPVTYEKAIREKILKSFEKGIQKSLPIEIQEDKDLMKKFRVRHGANEPAAFAVCALSKLEIGPKNEEDKVYYGVFDFGGGTTDFDFGIWKYSEEEDLYDYELEHFGAGGERYLGGENILKELAYKVFTDNLSNLRKSKIQYTRPEWCNEISGEEILVSQTKQARQNSTKVAKELRGIWENTTTERVDYISVNLFDSDGEVNAGFKLDIKEDNLKNLIKEKIEKGIKNFFIKMEDAFKGEDVKEVNIFLAGNSCKHPFVEEIFNRYIEEKKDKLKINIYNTKMFDELKETNKANPTVKTGVAFGLIYSRNSGRIKVISRDEKANIDNEINFKFYIGNNRRNKFNCIISPNSSYDEYKFFGIVKSDIFELYYSTSPEAQTNEMKSSEAKIKRINLKNDYDEEERYRIYLKADESDRLVYAIVKEEKDIEVKKFVEEGEVPLN